MNRIRWHDVSTKWDWTLIQEVSHLHRSLAFPTSFKFVIVLLTAAAWSLCADKREELSWKGCLFRGILTQRWAGREHGIDYLPEPASGWQERLRCSQRQNFLVQLLKIYQRQICFWTLYSYWIYISVDTACMMPTGCECPMKMCLLLLYQSISGMFSPYLGEIGRLKPCSLHLIELLIEINGDSGWVRTALFVPLPLQWSCVFVYVK